MIELRGLTKRYGPTLAVDDLSFQVQPGKVTGFLGPNGARKSTSMRMVLGLDRPTTGQALVGRLRKPVAAQLGRLLAPTAQTVRQESDPLLTVVGLSTAVAVLFAPPILGALVSNEIVATLLDYLPAGLSTVLVSGTGERYSPEMAALLLGAWAVGALAVGVITLHRRDP